MKRVVRYVLLWGPLALSVKNWVIDITPVRGLCLQPVSRPGDVSDSDWVLIQKYKIRLKREFTRGDVVYLRSPEDPNSFWVRRLVGLEGDWVSIPEIGEVDRVQRGKCWLDRHEGGATQSQTRSCAVPIALIEGRISHIIWPPSRIGVVETHLPYGRVLSSAGKAENER